MTVAECDFKCMDSNFKKSLPKCLETFSMVTLSSSLSNPRASSRRSTNLSLFLFGATNFILTTLKCSLLVDLYLLGVFRRCNATQQDENDESPKAQSKLDHTDLKDIQNRFLKLWGLPDGQSEQEILKKIGLVGKVVKAQNVNNIWYVLYDDDVEEESIEFVQESFPTIQYVVGSQMIAQDVQKCASILNDSEDLQKKKLEQEKLAEIAKKQQDELRQKQLAQQQEFLRQQEEQKKRQEKEREEARQREEALRQQILEQKRRQEEEEKTKQQELLRQQQLAQESAKEIERKRQEQLQQQQQRQEQLRVAQAQEQAKIQQEQATKAQVMSDDKVREDLAQQFAKSQVQQKQQAEQKELEYQRQITSLGKQIQENQNQVAKLTQTNASQQEQINRQQGEIQNLKSQLNQVTQQRDQSFAKLRELSQNQGSTISQEEIKQFEPEQTKQDNVLFKLEFWLVLVGAWLVSQIISLVV